VAVAVGYDLANTILEDEKGWTPDVITMVTAGRRAIEQFPLSGFFSSCSAAPRKRWRGDRARPQ
jgi:hypothetical protein